MYFLWSWNILSGNYELFEQSPDLQEILNKQAKAVEKYGPDFDTRITGR